MEAHQRQVEEEKKKFESMKYRQNTTKEQRKKDRAAAKLKAKLDAEKLEMIELGYDEGQMPEKYPVRKKYKKAAQAAAPESEEKAEESMEEDIKPAVEPPPVYAEEAVPVDPTAGMVKKYNGIRIPFELEDDPFLRLVFGYITIGVLVIFFLYKAGTQANYVVIEDVDAYGKLHSQVQILSGGVLIFALFLDLKEIYHTLKNVIPWKKEWIPYVTMDVSSEANAMYIGSHTVSLSDIYEAHSFTKYFAAMCIGLYGLGCFPWCLFSMILRDQYLTYNSMRIITPSLGGLIISRAILGSGIFLKALFAIQYGADPDIKSRESVGAALQNNRTFLASIHTMLVFGLLGCFFISIFAVEYLGIGIGACLLIGLNYGALTGCVHGLPIHPWMLLTVIEDGVWLRLKKKERCPCVYWGRYCTDMHTMHEMFIVFPRDTVLFMSKLKGSSS